MLRHIGSRCLFDAKFRRRVLLSVCDACVLLTDRGLRYAGVGRVLMLIDVSDDLAPYTLEISVINIHFREKVTTISPVAQPTSAVVPNYPLRYQL
jgi:hypothetical protein